MQVTSLQSVFSSEDTAKYSATNKSSVHGLGKSSSHMLDDVPRAFAAKLTLAGDLRPLAMAGEQIRDD